MAIPDDPFWREFILELPAKTAKFASVAADGSPRITPVWVDLDGDDVVFTTHETSAKAKAIRRDRTGRDVLRRRAAAVQLRDRPW